MHATPAHQRKRTRRRDKTRAQDNSHDGDEGADAAKRQRSARHGRQLRLATAATLATVSDSVAASDCHYVEMAYMGSTRAVNGPGFCVRELLFDGQTSTLTSTENAPFQIDEPTLRELAKELHTESEPLMASSAAAAERGTAAFQASGGVASPFPETNLSVDTPDDNAVEDANNSLLSQTMTRLVSFTRTTITGSVSMTWATGVSTGAATLTFPSPAIANTFIESVSMGKFDLPSDLTVILLGFIDDDEQTLAEREHEQRVKELTPWYPPLKIVHSECGSALFFDEFTINTMSATEVCGLRFVAQIVSGLPLDFDEVELAKILHPLQCDVVIQRRASAAMSHEALSADRARLGSPLQSCLRGDGTMLSCEDYVTERVGVRVHFADLERLAQVERSITQSPLWESMESPCGHPVRLAVAYELHTAIGLDMSRCFRAKLDQVRLLA